eukprot:3134445-Heterocapsa_arctica.AAC.1
MCERRRGWWFPTACRAPWPFLSGAPVQEDVMVARSPGALVVPFPELHFIPSGVVFRASLARLGSSSPRK